MNRLAILTIIAAATIATLGCSGSRSACRWNQGDACNSCGSGDFGAYQATGPIYEGGMLPPPSNVLPGPVVQPAS
jgi:hypothetical protein